MNTSILSNIKFLLYCFLFLILSCSSTETETIDNGLFDVEKTMQIIGLENDKTIHKINGQSDTLLTTTKGFEIQISENSFVDQQGNLISGEVDLSIKEVVDVFEIFSENISTTQNGNLLETKGMLEIRAFSQGEELQLATDKSIGLVFPGPPSNYANAELFYGNKNENGVIEWELDQNPTTTIRKTDSKKESTMFFKFLYNDYDDIQLDKGFLFNRPAVNDSLSSWLGFSNEEIKALINSNIEVYWTLFEDGDFQVYAVKGNVSKSVKNHVTRKLNNIPHIPPFHRDGGIAIVDGILNISFSLSQNTLRNNFRLNTNRLGWINCDVFLRIGKPIINTTVTLPNGNALTKIVFKNYKTIVSGILQDDGKVRFERLPEGEEIQIVAAYTDQSTTFLSITETTVREEIVDLAPARMVNIEQLKTELNEIYDQE